MGDLTAPQRPTMDPAGTSAGYASFVGQLNSGESLTGVPEVTEVGSSDLTIASVAVTVTDVEIEGQVVPAGKAVQFSVTGAVAGTSYRLKVVCGTNGTPAQVLVGYMIFSGGC